MRLDCIRIVEAAYAPAAEEGAWMRTLLEPFEPLSQGLGVVATVYELDGAEPSARAWASRSTSPEVLRGFQLSRDFLLRRHLPFLRRLVDPALGTACWTSSVGRLLPDSVRQESCAFFAGTGVKDGLGVVATEPGAPTVVVSLPAPRRFPVAPRTLQQLARVSAHLSTALRLRTRLHAGEAWGAEAAVEAVLDPSGRVQHAEGAAAPAAARRSLVAAVRSVERARGRLRRADPDEALAIWRAIFDGRWSIVERTEADGRRFLLARRNAPGFTDPDALAPGERDVLAYAARGLSNKHIGYLLGVATSTVAARLASGMRKLGLASRREAIAVLGAAPDVHAPAAPRA